MIAIVVAVIVLAAMLAPVVIDAFGADDQARNDQSIIAAGLAEVGLGMSLHEFNAAFNDVSRLPQSAISLIAAEGDQPGELMARGVGGADLGFFFDPSSAFTEGTHYAVAVFPRTREGPSPTFVVFDKNTDMVVAKSEVECLTAMALIRQGPVLPPEAYQEGRERREEIQANTGTGYAVWISARTRVAQRVAWALSCVPRQETESS